MITLFSDCTVQQPRAGTAPGRHRPGIPADDQMRDAGRVEVGAPSLLGIPSELEVVALPPHPDCDGSDAGPGVEPAAERAQLGARRS